MPMGVFDMKDNTRCRECAYHTRLSMIGDEPGCFYCGITGKARMLKCPAGDECEVFRPLEEAEDIRRKQFFDDNIITYGECDPWHMEEKKDEALYIGFRAYSGFGHGDRR